MMTYVDDSKTVAFGSVENVCLFTSLLEDFFHEHNFDGTIVRSQWNGCHYVKISESVPELIEKKFWDHLIPQYPELRFLLCRTSEQDNRSTQIVRHRHEPHGFNLCLQDHTIAQTLGYFPSDQNPILVLEDFHDEVLRDQDLRHALTLLGYPVEMLVGCSVSGVP